MMITVAICTWNRASLLEETLGSLASLRIPHGLDWELLVVDNNSSDGTAEVIARKQREGRLPLIALTESKQGQSHARNCAIAAARGGLIIWTDDDVRVGPEWLANYVRASSQYPDAAFFGGPVRPWYPVSPPSWLKDQIYSVGWIWALLDPNIGERRLAEDEPVYGANMAHRTQILRRFGFDPAFGHVGADPRGGDEILLHRSMRDEGLFGVWLQDNGVDHYVEPARMTLDYVRRRAFADGKRQYDGRETTSHRKVAGVPRWLIREYVSSSTLACVGRISGSSTWLALYAKAAQTRGAIAAAYELKA